MESPWKEGPLELHSQAEEPHTVVEEAPAGSLVVQHLLELEAEDPLAGPGPPLEPPEVAAEAAEPPEVEAEAAVEVAAEAAVEVVVEVQPHNPVEVHHEQKEDQEEEEATGSNFG